MTTPRRLVFAILGFGLCLFSLSNYNLIRSHINGRLPPSLNHAGPGKSSQLEPFPPDNQENRVCEHVNCDCRLEFTDDHIFCKSTHNSTRLVNFNHHICPQNFKNAADFVYHMDGLYNEGMELWNKVLEDSSIECIEDVVIYVRADKVDWFLSHVYPNLKVRFVLVTGAHTISHPSEFGLKRLTESHSKIIHWFGQNPSQVSLALRDRFTPIPLGLNCFEHSRALDSVSTKTLNTSVVPVDQYNPLLRFPVTSVNSSRLLIANFHPDTHESRKPLWKHVCEDGAWNEFAVCKSKAPGVEVATMLDTYLDNMDFPFWLSPRGRGLDCHRNWEALYLGRIPVIMSSPLDPLFDQLPVYIVDSWDQITQESLLNKYEEVQKRNRLREYDFSRLTLQYWTDQLLPSSRQDMPRPARCWAPKSR